MRVYTKKIIWICKNCADEICEHEMDGDHWISGTCDRCGEITKIGNVSRFGEMKEYKLLEYANDKESTE
jgi:hypothetical protein